MTTMTATLTTTRTPIRSLLDLLIRDDPELDERVLDEDQRLATIQGLLAVSFVSLALHGAAVGAVAQFLGSAAAQADWLGAFPVVTVPLRLCTAFMLALGVCLPSFYFFTQLAGLDAPFRVIVAQALRVQARTGVLLLGALPVYTAIALGSVVGVLDGATWIIRIGMALPFMIGIAGLISLYESFERLSQRLDVAHVRRSSFIARTVLAWSVLYAVVCPIALFRIGEVLGGLF